MPYRNMARVSLEDALKKIYEIRGYLSKDNRIVTFRSFPSIMVGHKVRLVLCDDEEVEIGEAKEEEVKEEEEEEEWKNEEQT